MNLLEFILTLMAVGIIMPICVDCITQELLHKERAFTETNIKNQRIKIGKYKDFKREFKELINRQNCHFEDNIILTHMSEYLSDSALNINTNEFKFDDYYMFMKNPISLIRARNLIKKTIKNKNKIEKWS